MATEPTTDEQLIECMTAPSDAVRDAVARYRGDVVILGVGGKMGPTLAELLVRAQAARRVAWPDSTAQIVAACTQPWSAS